MLRVNGQQHTCAVKAKRQPGSTAALLLAAGRTGRCDYSKQDTWTHCAAWLAWTRHAAPRVPAAALLQAAWPRRRCVARNRSAAAAGSPARAPENQLLPLDARGGHGKKAVIAHNQRSIMHFGWAALSQHASASSRKGAEPERLTPAAARASQEKGPVAGLGGGGGGADRDGSCKDSGLSCAHEGCCMPEELQFVDTSCDNIAHLRWAAAQCGGGRHSPAAAARRWGSRQAPGARQPLGQHGSAAQAACQAVSLLAASQGSHRQWGGTCKHWGAGG